MAAERCEKYCLTRNFVYFPNINTHFKIGIFQNITNCTRFEFLKDKKKKFDTIFEFLEQYSKK